MSGTKTSGRRPQNAPGERLGNLVLLEFVRREGWICRCLVCGEIAKITSQRVRRGMTHCGCLTLAESQRRTIERLLEKAGVK